MNSKTFASKFGDALLKLMLAAFLLINNVFVMATSRDSTVNTNEVPVLSFESAYETAAELVAKEVPGDGTGVCYSVKSKTHVSGGGWQFIFAKGSHKIIRVYVPENKKMTVRYSSGPIVIGNVLPVIEAIASARELVKNQPEFFFTSAHWNFDGPGHPKNTWVVVFSRLDGFYEVVYFNKDDVRMGPK